MFGGPGQWDNADKIKTQCPKNGCDGEEAAFFQMQIRSADEPMTMFYKVSRVQFNGVMERKANLGTVYDLWELMERELEMLFPGIRCLKMPCESDFHFWE